VLTKDQQKRFAEIRKEFPGTQDGPYFDISARCLLYGGARRAFDAYLDRNGRGTLDKKAMFDGVETARRLYAKLIGAEPDEIAFTRNVTDGIASIAAALPWKTGDNVVLCESVEHPANIYPWHGVARRAGVEVKSVDPENGHIPIDAILAKADAKTRAISVSSVSFSPGFRLPMAELGAECRRRGILLVVDGAQSIGVLDTDVHALKIDALAASTQKYLLSVYGMGFLFIRRELAETLDPVFLSRFSIDLGDSHEAGAGDTSDFKLAPGARRFDVGNYNYPAVMAIVESLKLLHELGSAAIEEHVCGLAREFSTKMRDAGIPVFGEKSNAPASHIVAIGSALSDNHDGTGDPEMADLHDYLVANGVRLGIRRGLLRFSFHLYNNSDDIDRAVALARKWRATKTKKVASAA
jgi:selenocysteine lyase/cysteine desulfurase